MISHDESIAWKLKLRRGPACCTSRNRMLKIFLRIITTPPSFHKETAVIIGSKDLLCKKFSALMFCCTWIIPETTAKIISVKCLIVSCCFESTGCFGPADSQFLVPSSSVLWVSKTLWQASVSVSGPLSHLHICEPLFIGLSFTCQNTCNLQTRNRCYRLTCCLRNT